jgi:hypothetical protein
LRAWPFFILFLSVQFIHGTCLSQVLQNKIKPQNERLFLLPIDKNNKSEEVEQNSNDPSPLVLNTKKTKRSKPKVKEDVLAEESIIDSVAKEIEEQREYFSDQLLNASNSIDIYFSNNQYLKTRNATNLRISNESNFIEDTGYENNFDISLRLKLPRSQDKLQLEIDQQVDELRAGGNNYNDFTVIERTRRDNGPTKAGLNYYEKIFDTEVRLTAGLDIKSTLVPWTNLKLKNDIFLTKKKDHYIQIINDFYGETQDGTEHQAHVTYNYQIAKNLLFRQTNQSRYKDLDHSLEVSNGLNLFHILNASNSMAYTYSGVSLNPGGRTTYFLDRHLINVSYRHRLFKKHYYVSVTPGLIIPKEKSWEVLTSFQFKIEIYFGNP